MYTSCLFCSSGLGTNEAIETFPVGARVAFDAWKGRLWAVCPRCHRWNLAPIEERWEAVEAAEKLFVDSRTRVHSQNIGLSRLPDGTRLVRIGALPGEFAAWRYGSQLVSRRHRHLLGGAAVVAGVGAVVAGMPLLLGAGVPLAGLSFGMNAFSLWRERRLQQRVVHVLEPDASPTGERPGGRGDRAHRPCAAGRAARRVTRRCPRQQQANRRTNDCSRSLQPITYEASPPVK